MIHVGPPGKHDSAFGSPRFLLAVCLLAIGSAAEAFAGVIVTSSSSETVQFQQMQITPSISSPPQTFQFNPTTGMLITAGYPFPVLGNVVAGPQTYTRSSGAPADFLNNVTKANAAGLTPTLPNFGASTVSASASASLNQGINALDTQLRPLVQQRNLLAEPQLLAVDGLCHRGVTFRQFLDGRLFSSSGRRRLAQRLRRTW